jgi:hypothetical protein
MCEIGVMGGAANSPSRICMAGIIAVSPVTSRTSSPSGYAPIKIRRREEVRFVAEWLPDSRQISFLYNAVIYTVPID